MSDRSYTNDMMDETGTSGVTLAGFLVGAVVGAGLALLLAPAPGGDTRRKIGETARKLSSKASNLVAQGKGSEDGGSFSTGSQTGETFRSGGRREPIAGGRTPQPGAP